MCFRKILLRVDPLVAWNNFLTSIEGSFHIDYLQEYAVEKLVYLFRM